MQWECNEYERNNSKYQYTHEINDQDVGYYANGERCGGRSILMTSLFYKSPFVCTLNTSAYDDWSMHKKSIMNLRKDESSITIGFFR